MTTLKQKSKEAASNIHEVYLSLGSNLGNRLAYLSDAVHRLGALPGSAVESVSSVYETEPVGFKKQPDFLNLALHLRTSLSPAELFQETKQVEGEVGRQYNQRWHAREIDIDILLYDGIIFRSQLLFIPHPEMTRRRFVLLPLSEIAGSVLHPVEHYEVRALLEHCEDTSRVTKTEYELAHP